jgi:hypothetical protein
MYLANPPGSLLDMPLDRPSRLDMLWAGYFASGKAAYIERLTTALALPEAEEPSIEQLLVTGAARWSLVSNGRQHEDVRAALRELHGRSTGALRTELESILERAAMVRISLAEESAGEEPKAFVALAGNWTVVEEDGEATIRVDGSTWAPGTPPVNLDAKAALLFPEVPTFPERMRGALNYQLAVARDVPDFQAGRIRVDFKLLGGETDQYASIMFGMQPDANHHALRYNTKDGDLALWRVVDGERERLHHGGTAVAIPLGEWHTLELVVEGKQVEGFIDGQKALEYVLPGPVSGRVGMWTKPDSVTVFRGFEIRY